MNTLKERAIKLGIAVFAVTVFVGIVTTLFWRLGLFEEVESLSDFFSATTQGYLMYFLIYIAVKFSMFIPLSVVIVPFSNIAPVWVAFLLGSLAEIIGGLILYIIGYTLGKKFIIWLTDEKTMEKWQDLLYKGKYTIFLLLLFPFAPNQIIIMLSGSGRMKMKIFLPMIVIAQPIGVMATILVGKGFFELFNILPTWLIIPIGISAFALVATIMYFSFKYQRKIDNIILFIKKIFTKKVEG